ncbi:MAG: hypothetical protein PHD76_00190 [Methylacidiphilales bacterium]|nr:hypothetical protein [Candidatus Methylacidiphilales bacterium]
MSGLIAAGHLMAAGGLFAQQTAPATPGFAPAEGDIRDVKGLWVPDYSKIIYAVLLLLGILALLALGIWLYKKWRNSRKPMKSLSELTLEQLEEAKRLIRDGNAHEFLGKVSDIVRRYLELRFNLPVTQQTTEEFLRTPALVSEAMLESHSELLKAFLQYCDLVKFARSEFNVEQMNLMLYSAIQFVEATAQPTTGNNEKNPAQPATAPVPQGEAS